MILILDASVVIKWFVREGENHLGEADRILELLEKRRVGLVEPDLLWIEVANVLKMAKKWDTGQVSVALSRLDELNFRMVRGDRDIVSRAVEYAQQYGISVYDGVYVATAIREGVVLVSDNPKHHGQVKDGSVVMLGDLPVL